MGDVLRIGGVSLVLFPVVFFMLYLNALMFGLMFVGVSSLAKYVSRTRFWVWVLGGQGGWNDKSRLRVHLPMLFLWCCLINVVGFFTVFFIVGGVIYLWNFDWDRLIG